jgi:uncharacterized protein with ATP-grasp and redox domains
MFLVAMKIQPECVPCLLKRILFEAELSTTDAKRRTKALRAACKLLSELYDPSECSATIATKVHQAVYAALGDNDPYASLKETSTDVALSLVPKVTSLCADSQDPLRTSMVCAIIGNVLDFGIEGSGIHPRMLEEVFDRLYAEGLGHDDYPLLRRRLMHARRVVLCTDNCGEIVFDKLMCAELKRFRPDLHITAIVKGAAVLSDATQHDAKMLKFDEVVDELFTTGCFCVGVDFLRLPAKAGTALGHADIILSKGMANYESFSETSYRPVAYLLRTKCGAIARAMKLPQNISAIQVVE